MSAKHTRRMSAQDSNIEWVRLDVANVITGLNMETAENLAQHWTPTWHCSKWVESSPLQVLALA